MPELMSEERRQSAVWTAKHCRDDRITVVSRGQFLPVFDEMLRLHALLSAAEAHIEQLEKQPPERCESIVRRTRVEYEALCGGGTKQPCFNCETRPRTHGQLCETCNSGAKKLLCKLGLGGTDDAS